MDYKCEDCGASFSKLSHFKQHQRTENHWTKYTCDVCGTCFTRRDNLDQHKKKHQELNNIHCDECGQVFSRPYTLKRHKDRVHQVGGGQKRQVSEEEDHVNKRLKKSDDPRQFYTMTKIKDQRINKFKTTVSSYKVTFHDIEVTEDVMSSLKILFEVLIEDLTKGSKSGDLVRLTVQTPSLNYPIVVPFLKVTELTTDRLLAEIERVLQSNEDFGIDSGLIFEVILVDMPEGGVGKRCKFVNTEKFLRNKKCIIRIKNHDDLCCARAIVTAKARLETHEKWNSIRLGKSIQKEMAKRLQDEASVPMGKCGVEEIKKFQDVLPAYQIHVVSQDHFNGIIYKGPETGKQIYLYYHNGHYDVITSMAAFLSRSYFCTKCNKGFDHKEDHKCNNPCHACRKVHDPCFENWLPCEDCHRFFRGKECFDLHQRTTVKGNSTCRNVSRCTDCGKIVNKKLDKNHTCGQVYCSTCKDFFPEDHLCYMLPEQNDCARHLSMDEEMIDEIENAKTFIFFDFECTQDDLVQCDSGYTPGVFGKCQNCLKPNCGSYEHKPNMCVAQKVCTLCMDKDIVCEKCGKREIVFTGANTLDSFCEWLFSEQNYNTTVLCHNFQGYDSYPILQYLYKHAITPTIVPNGAKIMCLTVPSCKIKMIDSINFLPMALSKLPEMFGFDELKKGYFPHLFNRKENQSVVQTGLPSIFYYHPDAMKPQDRQAFMTWYEEHRDEQFDFEVELLGYCRSDVDILRRCALKFRHDFIEITGIDPFERITIASACNLVFRTKFLKPKSIALIPHHGYHPEQKQSVKAIQWIKYLSYVQGHRIQHAKNGGERSIGPYMVDGYYETAEGERVVLEFHGDFWHGNPVKYSKSTVNVFTQMTMGELFDNTLEKRQYLESQGYTYKCIWESDFDRQCQENPEMKRFIDGLEEITPLEPRDAFYGGRTEAYTLYKEASENEDIDYYDVTSLYPWVNKTGKIPVGHPEIITENLQGIENYEGIVKCKILPPKGLFHPVLPSKQNGKLMFHLCNSCAETQQQTLCTHTDKERAFVGTWVTDEVKLAIRQGYKVIKMYEVWNFKEISQYNPDTLTGGLFTDYVNTFLRLKQEASGWPDWCKAELDKQTYIDLYEQKEGIKLDYQRIRKNPGLRVLAKLMLNCFWGKFGQRSNMQKVDIVEDPLTYFDKLTSDHEEVTVVNFVSDEAVEMRWKYKEDFVQTNSKTNVVIAAYTTSQARIRLYSYLEQLGPRALYTDTDSVFFYTKLGESKPSLGDFLGDLKDEVPHNQIKTFVTGGPKNYGYQLQHPDKNGSMTQCKVRGITLNSKNLLNVNFGVIKSFVTERPNASVSVLNPHKISRDRDNTKLVTKCERKDYRLIFDKRVIREKFVSYPYGF